MRQHLNINKIFLNDNLILIISISFIIFIKLQNKENTRLKKFNKD